MNSREVIFMMSGIYFALISIYFMVLFVSIKIAIAFLLSSIGFVFGFFISLHFVRIMRVEKMNLQQGIKNEINLKQVEKSIVPITLERESL